MCTGDQYSAQLFAGIGGASHEGVLVKGSNYLETMARTKYVVFDKTGTMTQGVFEVSGVHHNTIPEEQLLEYAALAECSSSHPISKSLQKAYGKQIHRDRVTEIEELSGKGVTAKVDGIPVAAGNAKTYEISEMWNTVNVKKQVQSFTLRWTVSMRDIS